jgi:hypothetical protein
MTPPSTDPADRLSSAQEHLAAARMPGAAGPGPGAEALRAAYLDLLKLAVCDLAGTLTVSVGALPDGTVLSRELRGEELRLRSAGMDWPAQGRTMVGLGRLDDLQRCVEAIVADGVEGDLIEAGSWRGGASMVMRATLDALGDARTVCVADSFQGFPADEGPGADDLDLGKFDFLVAPLEEVRDGFRRLGLDRGVEFVPGFFAETLPALRGRRWALVRVDADTYAPTRLALECLYPGLAAGGYVILDDYGSFEGCRQAVDEFRRDHGIDEPIERVDSTCARWRRVHDGPADAAPAAGAAADAAPTPRAVIRDGVAHVPTSREAELTAEVAELRGRLARAESELARRSEGPLGAVRARVGGALRGRAGR